METRGELGIIYPWWCQHLTQEEFQKLKPAVKTGQNLGLPSWVDVSKHRK